MSAVIICGSREWSDVDRMRAAIGKHLASFQSLKEVVFITGGAPGADELGAMLARQIPCEVRVHHAAWSTYGRAAGPIRNQEMLDVGQPSHVLAFVRTDLPCKGTWDMIHKALKAGVPVTIIPGLK